MAMSDCIDCWETPCCCGSDYQHWTLQRLDKQIAMLQRVRNQREQVLLRAVEETKKK